MKNAQTFASRRRSAPNTFKLLNYRSEYMNMTSRHKYSTKASEAIIMKKNKI